MRAFTNIYPVPIRSIAMKQKPRAGQNSSDCPSALCDHDTVRPGGVEMADHVTPKDIEENVRQVAGTPAGRARSDPPCGFWQNQRILKAERLAAARRGIEETVEKFGDQYPRQKDRMIAWASRKFS